ncbi:MAG: pyridoxal phosphate-dependent aminotransferase [Clostridiales bacterium]|nr:pyridoxal phosphate-dependent aminotransferase [Clostridiales bacterium]
MKYNFDEVVSRAGRGQAKWEPFMLENLFGAPDLLSFWVADMDFQVPPPVVDALVEAAQHGRIGYTGLDPAFFAAYLGWVKRRHNWDAKQEWFRYTPGVVPAINLLLLAMTEEGDEILIQRPVYYPFTNSIEKQHRTVHNAPLIYKDGAYSIDFEELERKASSPKCTAFVMSNPHNPVGRVFTEEELRKIGDICLKHNVFMISDEIHYDLIMPGHEHFVYARLGEEYAKNCAVLHAPSKSFNLAGLQLSCIMIPDEGVRAKFDAIQLRYGITSPNYFAPVAARTAWNEGEDWLEACLAYIYENYKYIKDFCAKTWGDKAIVADLEGTYLCWIDFNKICSDKDKLEACMRKQAKVALDEGYIFGPEGVGFERINLACPKSLIVELMDRMAKAIQETFGA